MKVIMLKDVPKIGRKGEVKEVSEGYARNYLFKNNAAIPGTQAAIDSIKKESQAKIQKDQKLKQQYENFKKELEKRIFTINTTTGGQGQIYGGVKEQNILAAIYDKTKIQLDKNNLPNLHGLKHIGEHVIEIKLGKGITAKIKINLQAK